jgi:hypothetical protein
MGLRGSVEDIGNLYQQEEYYLSRSLIIVRETKYCIYIL